MTGPPLLSLTMPACWPIEELGLAFCASPPWLPTNVCSMVSSFSKRSSMVRFIAFSSPAIFKTA